MGDTMTRCQHCDRPITRKGGTWVDPDATGDDAVWREVCDVNDTFAAHHVPDVEPYPRPGDAGYRYPTD